MTTLVKGLPVMAGTTPLSISIEYDAPYQGGGTGLGASLRVYKGTWNPATTRWEDSTGAELAIPLPRPDQPDVALKGGLTARITHGTGQNIKTTVFPVSTYQTAPGVLDLTVDPAPLDLVAAPALQSLLADLPTLKAELQVETVNAREGGEDAYYFASVANLAATAAFDAAGMKGVPLQSDIPALKGFYILTDPSVVNQVYEKTTDAAAPVRRTDRERPSSAEVTRVSTAISHTTAGTLSATATTAGPQYYQGYRWLPSATGPANGVTVLSAPGGQFWKREYDGPVYLRWANPAAGSNIEPLLASLLAPGQPIEIVLPAEAYTLGSALSMVTGQLIMGAGKGKTRLDYTAGLAAAVTMTQATSGVTAGGGLQDLTLNDTSGKTGGHVGMLVRGINSTEFLTRVEVANFNVGLRLGANASDQNYFNTVTSNHFASCLIGVQFLGAPNDNAFNFNTYTNCDYAYDFSTAGNVAEHNVFTGENVEGCKNWRLDNDIPNTYMQTWLMLRLENPTTNTYVCEAVDPGRQLIVGLAIVPDEGSNALANHATPSARRGVRWSLKTDAKWSTRLGTRGSSYPYAYGAVIDEALTLAGTWNQPLALAGGTWLWGEANTGRLMTKAGPKPTSNLDGVALDGYEGQATIDPPSLAAGAAHSFTVTCGGAALGDYALVSSSADLGAVGLSAHVSAANTVRVTLINGTGAALDLPSTTFRVRVQRPRGS